MYGGYVAPGLFPCNCIFNTWTSSSHLKHVIISMAQGR